MENFQKRLTTKLQEALGGLGYPGGDAFVVQSNRPDLSDYQCNTAMAIAKTMRKNPREIAQSIADELSRDPSFDNVTVDGPGFINIKLSNGALTGGFEETAAPAPSGRHILIDYGGPNIAKKMHVGHLRAAIIGESLKRIMRACGDSVLGDVHFGDWGTPMGMLITQMKRETEGEGIFQRSLWEKAYGMDVEELSATYRKAADQFKNDDTFKEESRIATYELQNGNAGYVALWKIFKDMSVDDVRRTYDRLDVSFELWLGESDINILLPTLLTGLTEKGLAVESDGAVIIPLEPRNGNERAPLILKKTDGAYTYAATDLATIISRMQMNPQPEALLYVVDIRQKEHFEQVFEVARKAGYVPEGVTLEHIAFGTVNGPDGRPFKTREGGVMNLEDLIVLSENKVRAVLPEASDEEERKSLDEQANLIALGALKYQDLKNPRVSDYTFDVENFTKSEGKTGTYLQYAVARIHSILQKTGDAGQTKIEITHPLERDLVLALRQWPESLALAYAKREPSVISAYLHKVAQKFSSFYGELSVANEENPAIQASRIAIIKQTRKILVDGMHLLGLSPIERISKKQTNE